MVIFFLLTQRAKKRDNYCDSNRWDNFKESNQEKKQRTDTINEAKKIRSDHFTRSNK